MRRYSLTLPILSALLVLSLMIIGMARGGSTRLPTSQPSIVGRVVQRSKLPAKFTNQYRMEFVLIPEGKFTMGSAGGADIEKPAHAVTINQAFYIGRYEVTQWQWRAVMTTTVEEQRRKIKTNSSSFPMVGVGDDRATYYVSWQEARAFVQKLNTLNDGRTYRLPSEAEWEYVCRAGATKTGPPI